MITIKKRLLKKSRANINNCKLLLSTLFLLVFVLNANGQSFISFDFSKENGKIKPLNGINIGTVAKMGAMTDYMTQTYADLKIPYTRLHDCHYPYPDVVDIPAIFPLFHLDADDPANYNFKKTDDYILELLKSGSKISYRLGVSIEHSKIKYHINPPEDYDKWAKICVNIIRHYNDGWADGFHHNIKYWEVWNEPDISAMWSGSYEEYFELYETTVKAIKEYNPAVLVGPAGPANVYKMGAPLLAYCKERQLPIDFFSWHCYTADPEKVIKDAVFVRKLLDDYGYTKTEIHLNEWNYWPGNWRKLIDRYYRKKLATTEVGGMASTAFTASTFINLQDVPLDQAFFYSGAWSFFGLFDEYGIPKKQFFAFKAMAMLLDASDRVVCKKDSLFKNISVIGGLTPAKDQAIIMLSNFNSSQKSVNIRLENLPWKNPTKINIYVIDNDNNLSPSPHARKFMENAFSLTEELPAPVVKVLVLTPMARQH